MSFVDPRCPGMHLFEVNTQSGITTSEIIVHGDIFDEVAIPPPDTKFNKNIDNREVREEKNVYQIWNILIQIIKKLLQFLTFQLMERVISQVVPSTGFELNLVIKYDVDFLAQFPSAESK